MSKVKDMTNEVYNNLLVLRFSHVKNKNAHWICLCNLCGSETIVSRPNLRSGNTQDCGCQRSEKISKSVSTHKMSNSPTYSTWCKVLHRIKKGSKHSPIYGSIGIDPRWLKFENFLQDMGERPKGKTIDRIDNSKGYFKWNCRWATHKEQCRNKSTNVLLTYKGKTMCMTDWANHLGLHRTTIARRLKKNLPIDKVLSV